MDDKTIRRKVQALKNWYFASSCDDGPAHIVPGNGNPPLCGTSYDNRAYRRATKMCGNCRRLFERKWQSA